MECSISSELSSESQQLDAESSSSGVNKMVIVDGKFFKLVREKCTSTQTIAACSKCEPAYVEIKGHAKFSSNFLCHLKRKHGHEAVDEYDSYSKKKRYSKKNKQQLQQCTRKNKISQEDFERNILKFVLHSMIPLRIVENPFFNNIFEDLNISSKGLKMISRRSLTRKMEDLYVDNVQCLKDTLNNVKYVCTTADIWSGRRRSFLGVTVHWIREDMGRESAALACRRFRSSHTAERIAELINDIHDDFGLYLTKIRATVTNNGSNFLKAFREYSVNGKSMEAEEIVEDLSFGDSQSDNESEEDRPSEISDSSVVCKTSITKALSIILPKHIKCCSHTLNLCASVDVPKAISTCEKLSAMHNRVISKCNILWRAASRPKSFEILHDILGYTLTRPGQTRWNSLYDALKKILSIKDKCSQVFHALKIKNMITEAEFDYIEEHLDCAKPVAEALDILQGEKYMYYGATVSILFALLPKLESLNQRQWKFCKPLSECFLNSVRQISRYIQFLNT